MNLYEKIKQLASLNNINIAILERNCELSQGSIAKWQNSSPKVDNLIKIADYFSVTVGYLLGRENLISAESTDLPQDERQLLTCFKQCDEIDQARILAYAEAIAHKEVYKNVSLEKVKKY